jgi:uncharacterized protein (DUF488 family)
LNHTILTIGYSGYAIGAFVAALLDNGVKCLLDIREIPLSRKPGFSKSALQDHLSASGIDYRHFRLLGSPKALRHEVRETGDFERFFRGVRRHLRLSDSLEQLRQAIEVARDKRSCLMCCCMDWERCHRRCVIDAIEAKSHFRFVHLAAKCPSHSRRRAA